MIRRGDVTLADRTDSPTAPAVWVTDVANHCAAVAVDHAAGGEPRVLAAECPRRAGMVATTAKTTERLGGINPANTVEPLAWHSKIVQ